MRRILVLNAFLAIQAALFAQSPGGVSSGLVAWFKADAGTSSDVDGAILDFWNDQSGAGNNATQTSVAAKPKFKKFAFNGNPAIEGTGGTKFFNFNIAPISNSEYTIIAVVERGTGVASNQFFLGAAQLVPSGLHLGYPNNTGLRLSQNALAANATVPGYNALTETPRMLVAQKGASIGRTVTEYNEGATYSATNANGNNHNITGGGVIGRGYTTSGFTGYIGEIIIYNRVLTAVEIRQIQTYLSIKYGITIPVADHLHYNEPSFNHDIFGIGKDLLTTGLNQVSAKSENQDGMIDVFAPSSLDNGDYLIMGNNNGARNFALNTGSNCAIDSIMTRVWKARETGEVGTVTLKFDMTGSTPAFDPASLVLLIDQDGDGFNDETPIAGVYTAPYVQFTNINLSDNQTFTLGLGRAHLYAVASGNSTDAIWAKSPTGSPFTVTSWCSRVDVTINAGVTVTCNSSITCRNFNSALGSTLNLGSNNFSVFGNFNLLGTFNGDTGTVYFNGTSAQSLTGTQGCTLHNIQSNNTVSVTVANNNLNVTGQLAVNTGTFNTSGKLTLISSATAQGSIGPLTTGDLIGNVTIQRYHNSLAGGWVNLAAPIQSKTLVDWNDDLITSGFSGSDYPAYLFNNIQYYNEAAPGNKNQGFVGATNISNSLVAGRGYFVYMNSGVMNLDIDGTIYKGNQSLPVSFTNNGVADADGYCLVANPYPSAIDWDAAGWTKTNINNAIYVWNAAIQQYTTYVGGVGTNGGTRYIPSSQSFFVMANAASPTLTVMESAKSTNQGSFKSSNEKLNNITLQLKAGTYSDETIIAFNENSTEFFDGALDAYKMRSPVEEVPYMATEDKSGYNYSINTMAQADEDLYIPLHIETKNDEEVELSWTGIASLKSLGKVVLEDRLTGNVYDMTSCESVKLNIKGGENDKARFVIRIEKTATTETVTASPSVDAVLTDNGVQVNFNFSDRHEVSIVAYNMLGQQLISPIKGAYQNETIYFSDRKYAAFSIVEVTDLTTGERMTFRMGK